MEETIKIDKHCQGRAKDLVDCIFDKNYFREDVTREDMQGVEDFLAFMLQSSVETAIRCHDLCKKMKEEPSNDKR